MKPAVWFFAAAVVLLGCAVTFTIVRSEEALDRVRVVERGVGNRCVEGDKAACRELARALGLSDRQLRALGKLGPKGRDAGSGGSGGAPEGGGAGTSPSGGGPIGRVPSPVDPPAPNSPDPSSPPPASEPPAVNLDVPVVPRVCVGDLLGINCK